MINYRWYLKLMHWRWVLVAKPVCFKPDCQVQGINNKIHNTVVTTSVYPPLNNNQSSKQFVQITWQ